MLKLTIVKEHKDGSADYQFDYDEKFVEFYKRETGAKVVRKTNIGIFIRKMLMENLGSPPTPKI